MKTQKNNLYFMQEAFKQAQKAAKKGEVPVGCVIVLHQKIIAKAKNLVETKQNATQHAEIIAIHKASKKLKNFRLNHCELFVTLKPCAMCTGALEKARIAKIYYAAEDLTEHKKTPLLVEKIHFPACGELLTHFFQQKRKK